MKGNYMKKIRFPVFMSVLLLMTYAQANECSELSDSFPPRSTVITKMTSERFLTGTEVFIPHTAQGVQVKFSGGEFYTQKDGVSKLVQRANLSPELRGISADQLDGLLNAGYVTLKPFGGEEYGLDGKLRLKGGVKLFEEMTPSQRAVAVGGGVITALWLEGNHKRFEEWIKKERHRSISEWWNQGNHRSVWEWLTGVPSRNN